MRKLLLIFIRGYQWLIRPLLAPSCRFYPSCSCYAHEAISQHGAFKGLRLSISRLSRCHPWHPGGYDPVPTINGAYLSCKQHENSQFRHSREGGNPSFLGIQDLDPRLRGGDES